MTRWLFAGMLALAAPAAAQTSGLNAARAAGLIGERYDGYIGVAGNATATVRSQVASINIQRRKLYSNLAARRGASPQEVGLTAGCQLLARVSVGEAYLLGEGGWRRRVPGQPAPVPNYCR